VSALSRLILFLFFSVNALAQPVGAPDCLPVAPEPLVTPQVLGNGTPGSVSTAQIQSALNIGGAIRFNLGAAPSTIIVNEPLIISRAVIVDGGGLLSLSGADQRRIFEQRNPSNATYSATLQNLTLINGNSRLAAGDEFARSGGAILNDHGAEPWRAMTLKLINVNIRDSRAIETAQDGGGGALYLVGNKELIVANCSFENNVGSNGGALYTLGVERVKIVDSLFRSNVATGTGGNPGNGGNAGAVGVDGATRLVAFCRNRVLNNSANSFGIGFFSVMYDAQSFSQIEDSTFDGNSNPTTSGFATIYLQGGPMRIAGSTISNNQANGYAGLYLGPNLSGVIINSTIAGNTARQGLGGGIGAETNANVQIINSTIANNFSGAFAGGIAVGSGNQLSISNTLLINNTGGNAFVSWNINNPASAGSNNLQWPQARPNGGTEIFMRPGSVIAAPLVGSLVNNGGTTETIALLSGSPAIGGANAALAPSQDQRGISRSPPPDIGAFEFMANLDLILRSGFEN